MPPTPRERATVLPDPSPFVSWNSCLYQRKAYRCTRRSVFDTAAVDCELSTVNFFQKTAHHNILLDPGEVRTATRSSVVRARHERVGWTKIRQQRQHSYRYIATALKIPCQLRKTRPIAVKLPRNVPRQEVN